MSDLPPALRAVLTGHSGTKSPPRVVPPVRLESVHREDGATGGAVAKDEEFLSPAVLWEGVFEGWSGYAKLSREILRRVSNHLYVRAENGLPCNGRNEDLDSLIKSYRQTKIVPTAPFVRALGPDIRVMPRTACRRIVFTMMETEVVHPDMVERINRFDECWVPTRWNIETFRQSGVRIPLLQVPLGVDSIVYRPIKNAKLPACELISTSRAGTVEVPEGFLFLSVGLPSVRKGFDVLFEAFERVFKDAGDVALVCAITHSTVDVQCPPMKSRVYLLRGSYDEHGMAKIYNACNAYVSASRGEGWNLPAVEAAACGLPVIVPRHTAHPEVAGPHAYMFGIEGFGAIPGAEKISKWYDGMPFPIFGKRSTKELAELLEFVASGNIDVKKRAEDLRQWVVSNWSWDKSSAIVARRLLELQPPTSRGRSVLQEVAVKEAS